MKKLDRATRKELANISNSLSTTFQNLQEICEKYNNQLTDETKASVKLEVEKAIIDFNSAIADAKDFCQRAAESIQEYMDTKAENWQEGDTGGAYNDWREAWEDCNLDEISGFDSLMEEEEDGKLSTNDVEDPSAVFNELPEEVELS